MICFKYKRTTQVHLCRMNRLKRGSEFEDPVQWVTAIVIQKGCLREEDGYKYIKHMNLPAIMKIEVQRNTVNQGLVFQKSIAALMPLFLKLGSGREEDIFCFCVPLRKQNHQGIDMYQLNKGVRRMCEKSANNLGKF